MLCLRCGGMLLQNSWDSIEGGSERTPSTRCVNCGCIDDPVIRANRRRPARLRVTSTRVCRGPAKSSVLPSIWPTPLQGF